MPGVLTAASLCATLSLVVGEEEEEEEGGTLEIVKEFMKTQEFRVFTII